jgi:hypothetical protein
LDSYKLAFTRFFDDQRRQERKAKREAAAENEDGEKPAVVEQEDELIPVLDDAFVNETLEDNFGHLYPNLREKGDV